MNIDIDVIGIIYTPGEYDSEGNVTVAPEALPGYHVNTTFAVGDWALFAVNAATPRRVFGGHETHFYTFADAAEYEAHLATADLTVPVQPAPQPTAPVVNGVPQQISKRQAERILYAEGKLDDVEAIIAAAPPEVQIDWRSAKDLDRSWPALIQMQAVLGWTDTYVDNLFIEGYKL